jgi:hypothetical protein
MACSAPVRPALTMFDCMLVASETLEGMGTMGTIHEFPQWRAQRSAQGETGLDAQVVIFPGVRIERDDSAGKAAPRNARPATSSSDGGRLTR